MRNSGKVIYLRESNDGHRSEYERLFAEIFKQSGIHCTVGKWSFDKIFSRSVLFSSMLEEHPLRLILTALVRSIFGLRTISITFRPVQALASKSARLTIKRILLRLSRKCSSISILSLIPYDDDSDLAAICRYYIYDPQLWDLLYYRDDPDRQLMADIARVSGGRKILCAIGRQDTEKGFDVFSRLWIENPEMRKSWLFVSGGAVDENLSPLASTLQAHGAYLINRRISNAEIIALYEVSDAVWCCYHAGYDQASGIFGRAFQLGKVPVVRSGSLLESFADRLGIQVLPLDATACASFDQFACSSENETSSNFKIQSSEDLRIYSMSRISLALGLTVS